MTQIFISYKSEYVDFARSVREKLLEWGYQTWFDQEDIPKGSYFRLEIQKGLQNSQIICGVMTQEAFNSREVMAEWDYFLKRNKPLLPLKYAECEPLYHIEHIQYIDFTKDIDEGFAQLQKALPPPEKSRQPADGEGALPAAPPPPQPAPAATPPPAPEPGAGDDLDDEIVFEESEAEPEFSKKAEAAPPPAIHDILIPAPESPGRARAAAPRPVVDHTAPVVTAAPSPAATRAQKPARTTTDQINRQRMLEKVSTFWIKGVLER